METTFREPFLCEYIKGELQCGNRATIEYRKVEDDPYDGPAVYYTERCDSHPVTDPDYEPRAIGTDGVARSEVPVFPF